MLENQVEQIKAWLRAKLAGREKRVLIVKGPSGSGKTWAVKEAAKGIGEIVEYNLAEMMEEEIERFLRQIRSKPLFTVKIHLVTSNIIDLNILGKIYGNTQPVILEFSGDIGLIGEDSRFAVIHFYKPKITDVISILSKMGLQTPRNVKPDIRASLFQTVYKSQGSPDEERPWEGAETLLSTGKIPLKTKTDILPYLLDTAPKIFHGYKLYVYINALQAADLSGKLKVLEGFKAKNKFNVESYFFQRYKQFRKMKGVI